MNKKIIGAVLSVVMTAMSLPMASVYATQPTEVTLSGRYDTNVPVYVKYDGDGTVAWEYADSEYSDTWTTVSGANSSTWIPKQDMSKKWIRAVITSEGEKFYSDPKQLNERWYGKAVGTPDGKAAGTLPSDNTGTIYHINSEGMVRYPEVTTYQFTVGGQKFVLLDETEDDNSHFLVMSQYGIGARIGAAVSTSGNQLAYGIMGWLNDKDTVEMTSNQTDRTTGGMTFGTEGGYRAYCASDTSGDFVKLPKVILDNIDENAIWKTEPRMWEWKDTEITYKGGLSIPAWTEYEKYAGKVSMFYFMPNGTQDGIMWTRTPQANTGDGANMMAYNTAWHFNSISGANAKTASYQIRPIFYLKRDFFEKVKVEKMSTAVLKVISSLYTEDELLNLYTKDELEAFGYSPCGLTAINYDNITDSTITVDYSYGRRGELDSKMLVTYYDENNKLVGAYIKDFVMEFGANSAVVETPSVSDDAVSISVMLLDKEKFTPIAEKITN